MTEKTGPWWRSFVGKRRKAARESAAILEQDLCNQDTPGSTPHPSAEPNQRHNLPARSTEERGNGLPSDETYDDSTEQSTFSESSNRRNLRVSRSGRFKEKRTKRAGLPQNREEEGKSASAKSGEYTSSR
ncbi:proline-rich protein 15 [Myxocyprinus asiaticus]|uniref:proline-rich protein 15 n=1 Tax=Myxocyprinus asiaticus TaxID=70543 RepID=UPI002222528E|nr:proline-rich protein 15 [Myxocyprinus asiaticus]